MTQVDTCRILPQAPDLSPLPPILHFRQLPDLPSSHLQQHQAQFIVPIQQQESVLNVQCMEDTFQLVLVRYLQLHQRHRDLALHQTGKEHQTSTSLNLPLPMSAK
eukprot:TRINITY_DN559_c3_g1_i1.p2 TRINITY_DN559_c3_g1~~TRINITY_DN559_c3_g1_i1.p2  ORF type:complete len:105 (-),score=13.89 TRINITY_DN559_c3_g1_i1:262-576(-)